MNIMFHLRSNVLVLVLLAAALQHASSSSSSVVNADYVPDSEVLLAEEDESSSSSVDTTLDELQLVALKESYRDESLPMVRCRGIMLGGHFFFLLQQASHSFSILRPHNIIIIDQCHWSIGRRLQ
jgi:hypothetical protein